MFNYLIRLIFFTLLLALTGCAVLGYDHNPKYPAFNDGCTEIQPITYSMAKSHYHHKDWFYQPQNPLLCASYANDLEFQLEHYQYTYFGFMLLPVMLACGL